MNQVGNLKQASRPHFLYRGANYKKVKSKQEKSERFFVVENSKTKRPPVGSQEKDYRNEKINQREAGV